MERLRRDGLINCGKAQSQLLNVYDKLIVTALNKVKTLFIETQINFNDIILKDDLISYSSKTKINIEKYYLDCQNKIENYLEKYLIDGSLADSTKTNINCLKTTRKNDLENIIKVINLTNEGKKIDESIKISKKANVIAILSLIISSILSLIAIVISLI